MRPSLAFPEYAQTPYYPALSRVCGWDQSFLADGE